MPKVQGWRKLFFQNSAFFCFSVSTVTFPGTKARSDQLESTSLQNPGQEMTRDLFSHLSPGLLFHIKSDFALFMKTQIYQILCPGEICIPFHCMLPLQFCGKEEHAFWCFMELIYFIQTPQNIRSPPWAGLGIPMVWSNWLYSFSQIKMIPKDKCKL